MQIAAMILGILSIPLAITGAAGPVGFVGVAVALAAIILSAIGMKKGEKKGFCVAGLITGIFGLILSLIITISCTVCYAKVKKAIDDGTFNETIDSLKSLSNDNSTNSTDWEAWGNDLANSISEGAQGLVNGVEDGIGDFANALGDALKGLGGN